ncbi:UNVERIFIED_CONTAM: hypothetical protein FKN15_046082 [Acipenser sinensis]
MSYGSTDSLMVSPSAHGTNKFDTAHRKKAVANIFENVNEDSVLKLFQKSGDSKAQERVKIIFTLDQEPEEMTRGLMALKQRKKDKLLRIANFIRASVKLL